MTGVAACPSFEEFYAALWDGARAAFPWQSRVAARAAEGHWPDAVAVPTGCGKTTCVEIAVWALAAQADRARTDRTAPTRLWWVVNRRALVDDTYTHAARIAKRLDRSDAAEPVAQVAARLRLLAGDVSGSDTAPALEVLRLRAGHARNRPRNLAAPAVICATVPMFGSRLLFRGHGAGRYTWPIDAAFAGVDSLVILDEAHISGPLVSLIEQVRDLPPPRDRLLPAPRHRPLLVPVSATADTRNAADIVALDSADRANPLIAQRLAAAKPLRTRETRKPLVDAVCAEIIAAEGTFTKALVYLNTPADARAGAARLRGTLDGVEVIVATGRLRGVEAAAAADAIKQRLGAGAERSTPTVVVATQTLEVGADLDADLLVTQSCGAAALVQRLGRLNRLGHSPHARALVIHPHKHPAGGLYPDTRQVLDRLRGAADDSGVAHAGPAQIRDLLEDLLEPPDRDDESPVLSESLLWEWVKTTNPPRGEAPVEAFYAGFRPAVSTADVLWRAHIPEPGEALWPPVSPDEIVEVSLSDARQLVNNNPEHIALLADDARTVEAASVDGIRAGCVLIAHTAVGSLDADGHWDPDAAEPVPDMAVISWGLPLTRAALGAILGGVTPTAERALAALDADDDAETDRAAAALAAEIAAMPTPALYTHLASWGTFAAALGAATAARQHTSEALVARPRTGAPRLLLSPPAPVVDAGDGLSFLPQHTHLRELDGHSADTARRALAAAEALGLPAELTRLVSLAGEFHDLGKTDPRFQRWLNPRWEPGDELMAKSHTPRWRRGLTRHANHDLTDDDADLLQHLIAAHHGRARPLLAGVADQLPPNTQLRHHIDGVTVTAPTSLAETDWTQPARFARLNRHWNPWGLAALETLVRQADWQSSQAADPDPLDVR